MRFRTSPMFFAYSRDWLTISSAVSVGRCFTETSAAAGAAPPAEGGAIGAGAGPCANTVLATKVVVSKTFAFTTAPILSENPEVTPTKSGSYEVGRHYMHPAVPCQHATAVFTALITTVGALPQCDSSGWVWEPSTPITGRLGRRTGRRRPPSHPTGPGTASGRSAT